MMKQVFELSGEETTQAIWEFLVKRNPSLTGNFVVGCKFSRFGSGVITSVSIEKKEEKKHK